MTRIVRCTIEMDMIEGEHFNPWMKEYSDEDIISFAISSFIDNIQQSDLEDYVQAKIVEEKS